LPWAGAAVCLVLSAALIAVAVRIIEKREF
jgi:hypothetical protein